MHHAFLIRARFDDGLSELEGELRVPALDVIHVTGDRMSIDDVRRIIREAYLTPVSRSRRSFIIGYNTITVEAQNALLKLLEEPPLTAEFYVLIPSAERLLPTLRSRLMVVEVNAPTSSQDEENEVGTPFLTLPYADRLALIAKLVDTDDTRALGRLMDAIEREASGGGNVALLSDVVELRRVFESPGASKKMILEHLALMLPPRS